MSDDKMLSQEEIDALLNQSNSETVETNAGEEAFFDSGGEDMPAADNEDVVQDAVIQAESPDQAPERVMEEKLKENEPDLLTPEEKDALGEVGNISMGTASTTLSELLQQRVTITSPKVRLTTQKELFNSFQVPYMIIQVEFKEGLAGFNILIMQLRDIMIMADLMMGGDGTNVSDEVSDMEISAAAEAMNQMIGTASTSLATMFSRNINISPPVTQILNNEDQEVINLPVDDPIVVVSFRLTVGELLDTEIMQVLSLETAKEEASLLWQGVYGIETPEAVDGKQQVEETTEYTGEPSFAQVADQDPDAAGGPQHSPVNGVAPVHPHMDINQERLAMLMDIPLKATVILGRAKKPVKEVLEYTPGAIVELSSRVEEPVEILVNGVLVARGEVVVVNENFGVKITDILTPAERVQKLTE